MLILFVRACARALEERRRRFGSARLEWGSRNQNCRAAERAAYGQKVQFLIALLLAIGCGAVIVVVVAIRRRRSKE